MINPIVFVILIAVMALICVVMIFVPGAIESAVRMQNDFKGVETKITPITLKLWKTGLIVSLFLLAIFAYVILTSNNSF